MLESPGSAASYYCPFALKVSVRVCSIAVDPMGPRGVTGEALESFYRRPVVRGLQRGDLRSSFGPLSVL